MSDNNLFYVSIGRQIGAGGLEIAKILGKKFGIPVYDKELLIEASKESGFDPAVFEKIDENRAIESRGGMFGFSSLAEGFSNFFTSTILDSTSLYKIESGVITEIAEKKSAIFIGRCSDYILRDNPNGISVFISASKPDRIARVKLNKNLDGIEKLSDDKISEILDKGDKKRATYYNNYTMKMWGMSESYDMCLNSTFLGTDGCADIIAKIIKEKFLI